MLLARLSEACRVALRVDFSRDGLHAFRRGGALRIPPFQENATAVPMRSSDHTIVILVAAFASPIRISFARIPSIRKLTESPTFRVKVVLPHIAFRRVNARKTRSPDLL
jgi:hypothetical protein